MRIAHVLTSTWLALAAPACARDTELRALADLDVGTAELDGLTVVVSEGLAHVRRIEVGRDDQPGRLELWAQAPSFELTLEATPATGRDWLVIVSNCVPDAVARAFDTDVEILALEDPRPTGQSWRVTLPPPGNAARARVQIAPPDAEGQDPEDAWRFNRWQAHASHHHHDSSARSCVRRHAESRRHRRQRSLRTRWPM
jgi:hypothetical protein